MLKEALTVAIETLSWMEMKKLSEHMALERTINQLKIGNPNAVRYGYRLICETTRRKNLIDNFINRVLKPKTINQLTLGVRAFLRLFVYQTRIVKQWKKPDLKEAFKIARLARSILGWKTLSEVEPSLGLLLTQRPELGLKGVSDEKRISLQTFHPIWFVKYCIKLLGRKKATAFLNGSVCPPPTYIRVNTLKSSKRDILEKLADEAVKLEKVKLLEHVYKVIEAKQPLPQTTSYKNGLFLIQDKASCHAAEAANPRPNMTVFDVCSAPGAKTTYLAQLMQNKGAVYSVDYSHRRIQAWQNEVSRMGVKIAEQLIADACSYLPFSVQADIVVLDPPCTGTGAFGKLPSTKWRLSPRSIEHMKTLQWQMINNCAEKVKSGGVLVYSTCSITVEENEMVIDRFLKGHPDFTVAHINTEGLPGLRGLKECKRFYPHVHECNGFFIAKLQRK